MRDGYSNFKFFQAITPRVMDATFAITGETVDKQGYETVTFVVNVGDIENTASITSCMNFMIQHADPSVTTPNPSGPGTFAYIATASEIIHSALSTATTLTSGVWQSDVYGSTTALSTGVSSKVYVVGYIGPKRYVRICMSGVDAGDNSVNVGAIAILGLPANWPVNEPA